MEKPFVLFIILISLLIAFGVVTITFGEQIITYNSNISCEQIRDCILLNINCLDIHVYNELFFMEWEFEKKANVNNHRLIYKKDCLFEIDALEVKDE